MNRGWVRLHRKIDENKYWLSEKFTRGQAWVDLLMIACHFPQTVFIRGIEINLQRGQFCWSQEALSKRWKWGKHKTNLFLKCLRQDGQLSLKQHHKIGIYSVLNYDKYQSDEPQTAPQTDHKQHHKQHQYNNDKNDKNENNILHESKFRDISRRNHLTKKQQDTQSDSVEKTDITLKVYKRLPLEKASVVQRIGYFLEDKLNTKIVNWGKQGMAVKRMIQAGFTEEQIIKTISYMADKDEFFSDKGFDLVTVSNQIGRYKALARKDITHAEN